MLAVGASRVGGALPPVQIVPEASMFRKSLSYVECEVFGASSHPSYRVREDLTHPNCVLSVPPPTGPVSEQDISLLFPDLILRAQTIWAVHLFRTPLRSKARRSPGGVPARNKAASAVTVRYALVALSAANLWGRILRFRQIAYSVALSAHVDEAYSSLLFTTDIRSALLDSEGPLRLGALSLRHLTCDGPKVTTKS